MTTIRNPKIVLVIIQAPILSLFTPHPKNNAVQPGEALTDRKKPRNKSPPPPETLNPKP